MNQTIPNKPWHFWSMLTHLYPLHQTSLKNIYLIIEIVTDSYTIGLVQKLLFYPELNNLCSPVRKMARCLGREVFQSSRILRRTSHGKIRTLSYSYFFVYGFALPRLAILFLRLMASTRCKWLGPSVTVQRMEGPDRGYFNTMEASPGTT